MGKRDCKIFGDESMKYLIMQDDRSLAIDIDTLIHSIDVDASTTIANSFMSACSPLQNERFDLIIFDLYLPMNGNETDEKPFGSELLELYKKSINANSMAVLITKDAFSDSDFIPLYNEAGIPVVSYSNSRDQITNTLKVMINKVILSPRYDFLIVCALPEELEAFHHTDIEIHEMRVLKGLNTRKVVIGEYKGLCIEPLRPGPVDTAIVTSKAIDYFCPRLVAMSGICAGIEDECKLLDILITNLAWNYQSGKTKNGDFYQEPYQSLMNANIQSEIQSYLTNNSDLVSRDLIQNLSIPSGSLPNIKIGATATGSGVVSDEDVKKHIKQSFRKAVGIDMEIEAFYRSTLLSSIRPDFFAIKTVVDLANVAKNDVWHTSGSIMSARLTSKLITHLLNKLHTKIQ